MKTLHPKIQALKSNIAGEYLTSRYVDTKGKAISADHKIQVDVDNRIIEGYLAVFGVRDSYGTTAVKGCFAKSLNDRGPKSGAKNKIIHLWMHNPCEPIGQYTELEEDNYGLRFKMAVDNVQGRPEQVLVQTRSGTINQYSYGFDYVWDKMEYDQAKDTVLMLECDLYEGSSVSIHAANPETYTVRTKDDFTKALSALGIEAEEIIQGLNRKQQIEVRQLITRYKSLTEFKPIQNGLLDLSIEPSNGVMVVGDYKLNLNSF